MTEQTDLFGDLPQICTVEKDPMQSGLEAMDDKIMKRFCDRHFALVEKLADVGLPKKGEQFRLVTRRTFNSIQLLEYICQREKISDLKLAIYSINYNAALILVDLIRDGKIDKCEILMSNLRNSAHRKKEEIIKNLFVDHPKISLFFVHLMQKY